MAERPSPVSRLPQPQPQPRWLQPRWLAISVMLGASGLVGACGADAETTTYSEQNREAFLASCTSPNEDQRMIRDVCECTYERIEITMAYDDFVKMEESLAVDALAPLPDPVAEVMAECFVEEVEL